MPVNRKPVMISSGRGCRERTFVTNYIRSESVRCKAFGVVHHSRAASYVSQHDDRDRAERGMLPVCSSIIKDNQEQCQSSKNPTVDFIRVHFDGEPYSTRMVVVWRKEDALPTSEVSSMAT